LGDGDDALKNLQEALTIKPKGPHVTPNTLYSENGWPTFESPISASRDVLDMLIQSWGGTIRVFPACPSQWPDAAFYDLRAEGAFLVSASRKGGRTQFVRIRSLAGEPCRVQCDLPDPVHIAGEDSIKLYRINGLLEPPLKKDQEVLLYSGSRIPTATIAPLPRAPAAANAWGVHGPTEANYSH
jgi:alpha-L-fucosidase 2